MNVKKNWFACCLEDLLLISGDELFEGVLYEICGKIERSAGQLTIQSIRLSIISINPLQSISRFLRK